MTNELSTKHLSTREILTRIRDDAQAALDALDSAPPVPKLGPGGEYSPDWLRALNNAYRNKFPDGYSSIVVDPNTRSRAPLILAGSLLWGDVPGDKTPEQAANLHRWCNLYAWGAQAFALTQVNGLNRILAVWTDGAPQIPDEYTLCLAPGLWPTEEKLEAAVLDLYERTFGPL